VLQDPRHVVLVSDHATISPSGQDNGTTRDQ
jgi:hypothetical protein